MVGSDNSDKVLCGGGFVAANMGSRGGEMDRRMREKFDHVIQDFGGMSMVGWHRGSRKGSLSNHKGGCAGNYVGGDTNFISQKPFLPLTSWRVEWLLCQLLLRPYQTPYGGPLGLLLRGFVLCLLDVALTTKPKPSWIR